MPTYCAVTSTASSDITDVAAVDFVADVSGSWNGSTHEQPRQSQHEAFYERRGSSGIVGEVRGQGERAGPLSASRFGAAQVSKAASLAFASLTGTRCSFAVIARVVEDGIDDDAKPWVAARAIAQRTEKPCALTPTPTEAPTTTVLPTCSAVTPPASLGSR